MHPMRLSHFFCVTQSEETVNREGINIGLKTRKKKGRQIFLENFCRQYYCNSLGYNLPIYGSYRIHVIQQGIIYTLRGEFIAKTWYSMIFQGTWISREDLFSKL